MELGARRELLRLVSLNNCIPGSPTGREVVAPPTGSDKTFLPQQEEEKIPLVPVTAQPMGDCRNSANEKSLYFKLSASSNGHFVYNSSSQVHKSVMLFFVSLGFHVV